MNLLNQLGCKSEFFQALEPRVFPRLVFYELCLEWFALTHHDI